MDSANPLVENYRESLNIILNALKGQNQECDGMTSSEVKDMVKFCELVLEGKTPWK